jgi:hypothetical protein
MQIGDKVIARLKDGTSAEGQIISRGRNSKGRTFFKVESKDLPGAEWFDEDDIFIEDSDTGAQTF